MENWTRDGNDNSGGRQKRVQNNGVNETMENEFFFIGEGGEVLCECLIINELKAHSKREVNGNPISLTHAAKFNLKIKHEHRQN